jgi:hypothetical protein
MKLHEEFKLYETMWESDEDEYFYEDVIELFNPGGQSFNEVLIDPYLNDFLNEAETPKERAKIKNILKSEELQNDLIEAIKAALDASNTLWNYISEYTAEELSDMDGPWNTVMDIVNETISKFLNTKL